MSGIRIEGLSGDVVESVGGRLSINTPVAEAAAGFCALVSEQDIGTITGSRRMKALEATEDYRLRVGIDTLYLSEQFPGAALNSALWTAPVTTMTVTVNAGVVRLNAGLSVATGTVARVSSYRSFPVLATCELFGEIVGQFAQPPQIGNVTELGFGIATASAAPTDGAFFRVNAAGNLLCVVVNNSVETVSEPINFAAVVGTALARHYVISVCDDRVKFWIDDNMVAAVDRPAGASTMVASANLPLLLRTLNSGATSAAQALSIGLVAVWQGDPQMSKPWSHVMAGAGATCHQGQTGGTMGSTALYTNNLAAGAGAAATNTLASLGVGLGGQFSLQPTLAAGTDGIIQSYQVPLGTAALPGKSAYITGVRIHGAVTTVLVGGPVIGAWSLAFGHTAVSLATTETATSKAPRRVPLGIQVYATAAAVGVRDDREIVARFDTPICVQPGEFIQLALKNLGTVTSSGVITNLISFDGYME